MKDNIQFTQKSLFKSPFANLALTTYSEGAIMEPHCHKQTQISIVIEGANHEESEVSSLHFGRPAEVIIKPKGLMHSNTFSDSCTIITAQLKEENHSKLRHDGMLKEWRALSPIAGYQLLLSIMKCRTESQYYHKLNEILTSFSSDTQPVQASPPGWLQEVRHLLESSYHAVIRNDFIGKTFNRHPVYIARMFKKYFGMSMKTYVKLLRTNGAIKSISSEEDILAGVALQNGFTDQSHLNRTFKSQTGLTPHEFRRLVR